MTTYNNKELLVKLTELTIKDVVEHYRDRLDEKGIDNFIERGIAKRVTGFVPDEWTTIDIAVYQMANDLNTLVQFTNDAGDSLTAIHNEEGVLAFEEEAKKDWWNITWSEEVNANGVSYAMPKFDDMDVKVNVPDIKFEGFGVNTADMIKDMISKPYSIGVSNRGVADIDDAMKFAEISWIDSVQPVPDSNGTSGWSEEVTKAGSFYPNGIESYDDRMLAYDPYPNGIESYDSRMLAYDPASTQEDYYFGYPNTAAYEPIEFTLDDLEELTELINTVESQEMKF